MEENNQANISQEQFQPNIKPFAFDGGDIEVTVDVSTDPQKEKLVSAIFHRSSKEDLITREAKTTTEIIDASTTEDEIRIAESKANGWLFNRIVKVLKGVKLKGEAPEVVREYREPSDQLLSMIPDTWKSALVKGQYNVTAKFVEDDDEGVTLGDSTLPVDFIIGDEDNPIHVIRFDVPTPSTTELEEHNEKSTKLRQPKQGKRDRSRIVTDLAATIEFFDSLMSRQSAAIYEIKNDVDVSPTVQGKTFTELSANPIGKMVFLEAIDPLYKRNILGAALSRYNAKKRD